MVDFVKVHLRNINLSDLINHSELDFIGQYSVSEGDVKIDRRIIAKYNGLKFIIYPNEYVELQGSLHKYYNLGLHNWNDFHFSDLQSVLNQLEENFSLELDCCVIQNIELGVNLSPAVATKMILDGLLYHRSKPFERTSTHRPGYIKQVQHERYRIKAYDKRLQYCQMGLNDPRFRYELSYKKMVDINELGIHTLNDLKGDRWHLPALKLLIKTWDKVMLYDYTIRKDQLNDHQRETRIHQWQNASYWLNLTKQLRHKQKKKYNECMKNNSDQLHTEIKYQIDKKWRELSQGGIPINQKESIERLPINTSIIELNGKPQPNEHYVMNELIQVVRIDGVDRWFTKVYNSDSGRVNSRYSELVA